VTDSWVRSEWRPWDDVTVTSWLIALDKATFAFTASHAASAGLR
jgi:hypothetical protein